jgi:hypothetical protein
MTRFFVACIAIITGFVNAQEEPAAKDTLIRFTSFGLAEGGSEYLLAVGEAKTTPFVIPDNGFSAPVTPPAPGNALALGNAKDTPFRSLVTVKLPETGKRFLVILLPDKNQALRAIVLRADDPQFRPGQILIMNLAPEPLAADLGGEKLTFTPGSQTIFRPQRKNDLANYQVRFYQAKEGKPKLFAASLWPYFDAKRAFVFLYVDPTTGSPTYRSIDEFTDWLEN